MERKGTEREEGKKKESKNKGVRRGKQPLYRVRHIWLWGRA